MNGGIIGIQVSNIESAMRIRGIEQEQIAKVFELVQVMEDAALQAVEERRSKSK